MDHVKSDRVVWIDLLRIFCVFSMMLIHVAASRWQSVNPTTFSWQVFNFYDCLVRFCVPVFVMISGVFFLDSNRQLTYKKLFSKNIIRIITAFVFWSFAYASIDILRSLIKHTPFNYIGFLKAFFWVITICGFCLLSLPCI